MWMDYNYYYFRIRDYLMQMLVLHSSASLSCAIIVVHALRLTVALFRDWLRYVAFDQCCVVLLLVVVLKFLFLRG